MSTRDDLLERYPEEAKLYDNFYEALDDLREITEEGQECLDRLEQEDD